MTREQAIQDWIIPAIKNTWSEKNCQEIIKALEQKQKTEQFTEWVATEIFDDNWEYNKDSFAELACRKLAKLGIVKENGDKWELVESQKSKELDAENLCDSCKTKGCIFQSGIVRSHCDFYKAESEE